MHGDNPHPSLLCEFLLAPRKQSTSGPALCWRNHPLLTMAQPNDSYNSIEIELTFAEI